MSDSRAGLGIRVQAESDVDDEELAALTSRLREELLDLDVEDVSPMAEGGAPAGAKGFELLAVGGLVVRFLGRQDVLRGVVATVRSWLARQPVRSIELELDGDTCKVTGATSEEQDKLIDLWIERHTPSGQ